MEQPGRHVTSELLRIGEMRASASGGRTRCHRHDRASAIAPINRICANRGGAVTFRSARRTAGRRAFSRCFSITQCDAAYQLAGIRSVADGPGLH
jgi:hypothetical protein